MLVAVCALAALLGMILLVGRLKPEYQATTSIRVDQRQMQFQPLEVLRDEPPNNLSTEMEMLRARSLAAAVVDSLGLRLAVVSPEQVRRSELLDAIAVPDSALTGAYELVQRPANRFQVRDRATGVPLGSVEPGGVLSLHGATARLLPTAAQYPRIELDVLTADQATNRLMAATTATRRSRDADLIDLRVRGGDPELVRDVANALAARFIADRRESRHVESRGMAKFLREQLRRVTDQLTKSEQELRNYLASAGAVDIVGQAGDQVRRTAELQAQRNALAIERSALQQLVAALGRADRGSAGDSLAGYRELVAFPTLLRSDAVSTLLRSLAETEDRRAELLSRRRPEDPEVQVLTNRVAALDEQLRVMTTTYLRGLDGQLRALDSTISEAKRELGRIPEKEMRAAQLQRDVQGQEQLYKQLQARLKEAEVAEAAEDGAVRIVDMAVLPTSPASQRRGLLLLLAPLAGIAVGIGIGLIRELRDVSVRTRGDAEVALGVPVLGLVPRLRRPRRVARRARWLLHAPHKRGDASPPVLAPRESDELAMNLNAYVRVHRNMLFARAPEHVRVIMFASALPGDGKTTSAANLALMLAHDGARVVLVDLDLRRGQVNAMVGLPRGPGAAEVLDGRATIAQVCRSVAFDRADSLDVIPTGQLPDNPTPLLASPAMDRLLAELAARYDYVIVDTPPLNVVADATLVADKVDSVVMVVRAGVTPIHAVVDAAEQARRARMPVVGTLLNDVNFERDAAYDSAFHWYAYQRSYLSTAERGK